MTFSKSLQFAFLGRTLMLFMNTHCLQKENIREKRKKKGPRMQWVSGPQGVWDLGWDPTWNARCTRSRDMGAVAR